MRAYSFGDLRAGGIRSPRYMTLVLTLTVVTQAASATVALDWGPVAVGFDAWAIFCVLAGFISGPVIPAVL